MLRNRLSAKLAFVMMTVMMINFVLPIASRAADIVDPQINITAATESQTDDMAATESQYSDAQTATLSEDINIFEDGVLINDLIEATISEEEMLMAMPVMMTAAPETGDEYYGIKNINRIYQEALAVYPRDDATALKSAYCFDIKKKSPGNDPLNYTLSDPDADSDALIASNTMISSYISYEKMLDGIVIETDEVRNIISNILWLGSEGNGSQNDYAAQAREIYEKIYPVSEYPYGYADYTSQGLLGYATQLAIWRVVNNESFSDKEWELGKKIYEEALENKNVDLAAEAGKRLSLELYTPEDSTYQPLLAVSLVEEPEDGPLTEEEIEEMVNTGVELPNHNKMLFILTIISGVCLLTIVTRRRMRFEG